MTGVALFAAKTERVTPQPQYVLRFAHSGTSDYSFTLRNADGTALSTSRVGIEHTKAEQGICEALVTTNQTGSTLNYTLSWDVFRNSRGSEIPYTLRFERSSLTIGQTDLEDEKSIDIALELRSSGIGSYTYELCTVYMTLDPTASDAASSGEYSDNLTFTLTPNS